MFLLAEKMSGNLKEEIKMENIEIKEEIQEEILPSSTAEDTCHVFIKEDVKMKDTVVQGNA